MLIGLYGGTFDPIHVGHVHAALCMQKHLDLRQIRLVLSARPGHRAQPMASVEHRWQMLCLACREHEHLTPDDSEVRRAGESYTIDTVREFRRSRSPDVPCWILGQDSFATLPEWYCWEQLLDHCNLVVLQRPGHHIQEPESLQALCRTCEVTMLDQGVVGQIVRVDAPMRHVSATDIRARIAIGDPVEHLLADPVCTYIRRHNLYVGVEKPF